MPKSISSVVISPEKKLTAKTKSFADSASKENINKTGNPTSKSYGEIAELLQKAINNDAAAAEKLKSIDISPVKAFFALRDVRSNKRVVSKEVESEALKSYFSQETSYSSGPSFPVQSHLLSNSSENPQNSCKRVLFSEEDNDNKSANSNSFKKIKFN